MADRPVLKLFTGPHCQLCDLAREIIYPLLDEYSATLRIIDINTSEALKSRYGILIPVIQLPDGTEKNWPFTTAQLRRMLGALGDGK